MIGIIDNNEVINEFNNLIGPDLLNLQKISSTSEIIGHIKLLRLSSKLCRKSKYSSISFAGVIKIANFDCIINRSPDSIN
jgi:hypothetical protein